jgi:ABC-type nickel/cobalt efflux system permease component RcnA
LGLTVGLLEDVEALRGDIASWLLIGFGLAYGLWGLRLAWRARNHTHVHNHAGSTASHSHGHDHLGDHAHVHGDPQKLTPWALFVIFVLGPCEPLIPILMYPAAGGDWSTLVWVTMAFGITTVATMIGAVFIALKGLLNVRLGGMEVYTPAVAGLIIALSGLSIKLFGL